jgi:hypothetical protein
VWPKIQPSVVGFLNRTNTRFFQTINGLINEWEVIGIALYTDMCGWVPDKWFYPKNADCFYFGGGITHGG